MAMASAPDVTGGHEQPADPVLPHDLRERPAGRGHERNPTCHGLDRRQREPLVQRRDHGHRASA
jgi:hypothetical protein